MSGVEGSGCRIEELGYKVAVPTPMGKMSLILINKGFIPTKEWHDTTRTSAEAHTLLKINSMHKTAQPAVAGKK